MSNKKILILGVSGMLGSAVFRAFYGHSDFNIKATLRNSAYLKYFSEKQQHCILTNVDVLDNDTIIGILASFKPDVVINCVGLIKQHSAVNDPLVTLPINSLFPHRLARLLKLNGSRLIHISTDCVFSGSSGNYVEDDVADAKDVYGVSKHLGETISYDNAVTLRTSIIGRELNSNNSLLDWFLSQQGQVNGYDNAIFSGLPTCELARVIRDIVIPNHSLSGLYHVASAPISKYKLLNLIAAQYNKSINIIRDTSFRIDRSLNADKFNSCSGYQVPDWPELIKRMYECDIQG